jgi:hypothetical protein
MMEDIRPGPRIATARSITPRSSSEQTGFDAD